MFRICNQQWIIYHSEIMTGVHQKLRYGLCMCRRDLSAEQLLEWTRHSLCADPRDRIFATLSLLCLQVKELAIEPDYTLTVSQTYQAFVKRSIKHYGRLSMLTSIEAELSFHSPSWVPDWSRPRQTNPIVLWRAASASAASVSFVGDTSLPLATSKPASRTRVEEPKSPKTAIRQCHATSDYSAYTTPGDKITHLEVLGT